MRKLLACIAIIIILIFIACGSESKPSYEKKDTKATEDVTDKKEHEPGKIDVTQDFDGIVLHVESESDTYKTGENFKIIAQVTNNTQEPVFIFKNSPCGCTTESNETCSHSEIITSIIKDDIRLVDGDTFGKGEDDAYDCLKLEPGQSFTQDMNYVAAKLVPRDKTKELKPISRPAKVYDCDLEDQLVPTDTGTYTGTSGIRLCGGYDDDKFDETIIDRKSIAYMIYITE